MASHIVDLYAPGVNRPVRIRVAASFARRALGLLGTRHLDDPAGLWIKPCRSVHTFWMRYAIDVVFLDAQGLVTKVVPALKPWRAASCRRARTTLELRAGLAAELAIVPGTRLPALT